MSDNYPSSGSWATIDVQSQRAIRECFNSTIGVWYQDGTGNDNSIPRFFFIVNADLFRCIPRDSRKFFKVYILDRLEDFGVEKIPFNHHIGRTLDGVYKDSSCSDYEFSTVYDYVISDAKRYIFPTESTLGLLDPEGLFWKSPSISTSMYHLRNSPKRHQYHCFAIGLSRGDEPFLFFSKQNLYKFIKKIEAQSFEI